MAGITRVCVVGAGPAGFYAAAHILDNVASAIVHVVDALPTPFGLVRYGVAPDHPEVKVVTNRFTEIASDPRFAFFGNVTVGRDVSLQSLRERYDAVLLAHGAADETKLGIPGEALAGVHSARDFVGWYNGLPSAQSLRPRLDGECAAIIGIGNVALDLARLLLSPPEVLRPTDMCSHAVAALAASSVRSVTVLARRGPYQAACTTKEVREMTKLPGVGIAVAGVPAGEAPPAAVSRGQTRMVDLLTKAASGSVTDSAAAAAGTTKRCAFTFYRRPVEFLADASGTRVAGVRVETTTLDARGAAVGTGVFSTVPASTVLVSVGYRTRPLPGLALDPARHTVPHSLGRVHASPGLYVAGWAKTGPIGVIASTMPDAKETAAALVADIASGAVRTQSRPDVSPIAGAVLSRPVVRWAGWSAIDAAERAAGAAAGKPREKLLTVTAMEAAAAGAGAERNAV